MAIVCVLGRNIGIRWPRGYRPAKGRWQAEMLKWRDETLKAGMGHIQRVQGQLRGTLFQTVKGGAGQMAQKLRELAALSEDPSLVPSTHIRQLPETNDIVFWAP